MSDPDEVDDHDTFDLSKAKVQSWESKDRKVATVRMSDENGLCDMKILLLLELKVQQMRITLGIFEENEDLQH